MNERQQRVGEEIVTTLKNMGLTPYEVVDTLEKLLASAKKVVLGEDYEKTTGKDK